MLKAERRDRILHLLSQRGVLRLRDAVRATNSGEITIRRDFNALAEEGLVERIRGGIRQFRTNMQPFGLREVSFGKAKQAIGRRAAGLLRDGDVAFIDGGTTTFQMADFLPDYRLRLITNSLRLATRLESRMHGLSGLEIFLTGGLVYPKSGLLVGSPARQMIEQYHANWAFLSAGGITEHGVFDTNEWVVDSERSMIARAEKVVVMADSSKLGRHAMCHVSKLEKIHLLITDAPAEHPTVQKIAEAGIEVITAE